MYERSGGSMRIEERLANRGATTHESLVVIRTWSEVRHNGPRPRCVAWRGLTHVRTIRRLDECRRTTCKPGSNHTCRRQRSVIDILGPHMQAGHIGQIPNLGLSGDGPIHFPLPLLSQLPYFLPWRNSCSAQKQQHPVPGATTGECESPLTVSQVIATHRTLRGAGLG